jgi:ferredoxin
VEQIAEMMGMPLDEAEEFVTKAYHRAVIKKGPGRGPYARSVLNEQGPTTYAAAVFYRRIDPLAMYEDWGDVPAEARDAVIEWQIQEFINVWQPVLEEIRKDPDAKVGRVPNKDYLLLDEALEMVDAAQDHVIIPCDCKEIVRACNLPREVCVRLDEGATATLDQGHGRRVTKEEMKHIVVDAHRAGLMATGNRNWKEDGQVFGFCNCCACDCYPIHAGKRLGLGDLYPRVSHVAERNIDLCHMCGVCARRCHFDAFYYDDKKTEFKGRMRKVVLFDPEKCRGCGLCATTCSEDAIIMQPLQVTQDAKAA